MKKPITAAKKARIVADYVDGMSSIAVGRKYRISSNTVLRYVHAAGVVRSHEEAKSRQGALKAAAKAAEERRLAEIAAQEYAESELSGGKWVRDGLVYRWVENDAA